MHLFAFYSYFHVFISIARLSHSPQPATRSSSDLNSSSCRIHHSSRVHFYTSFYWTEEKEFWKWKKTKRWKRQQLQLPQKGKRCWRLRKDEEKRMRRKSKKKIIRCRRKIYIHVFILPSPLLFVIHFILMSQTSQSDHKHFF